MLSPYCKNSEKESREVMRPRLRIVEALLVKISV